MLQTLSVSGIVGASGSQTVLWAEGSLRALQGLDRFQLCVGAPLRILKDCIQIMKMELVSYTEYWLKVILV